MERNREEECCHDRNRGRGEFCPPCEERENEEHRLKRMLELTEAGFSEEEIWREFE